MVGGGGQNMSQPVNVPHRRTHVSCVEVPDTVTHESLHRVREQSENPLSSPRGEWDNVASLMIAHHGHKPRSPQIHIQAIRLKYMSLYHQRLKQKNQAANLSVNNRKHKRSEFKCSTYETSASSIETESVFAEKSNRNKNLKLNIRVCISRKYLHFAFTTQTYILLSVKNQLLNQSNVQLLHLKIKDSGT